MWLWVCCSRATSLRFLGVVGVKFLAATDDCGRKFPSSSSPDSRFTRTPLSFVQQLESILSIPAYTMVSEIIRRATREQYEMQDKSLDLAHETSGCGDNDPVTELRFGSVAIPVDVALSETENLDAPGTQASQISLTQEDDEHIRRLDRSGALVQVVGSQSLLSQELVDFSQKNEPLLSQPTVDTTSMAKKLGLLEEDDEVEDHEGQAAAITTTSSDDEAQLPTTLTQANDASQISLVLSQSFGTLLSAAQAFHEQEEVAKHQSAEDLPAFMSEYHDPRLVPKDEVVEDPTRRRSRRAQPKLPARRPLKKTVVTPKPHAPTESSSKEPPASSKKRKQAQPTIAAAKKAKPSVKSTAAKLDSQPAVTARSKAQLMAKQAAELAEQAITNPEVAKRLLLTMALVRVNPRSAPEKMPGKGHVIAEGKPYLCLSHGAKEERKCLTAAKFLIIGFHWAQYPPLEGGEFSPFGNDVL